ncbi:MAG TPA: hypothetical protein DCR04_04760 [Flavobacteriales bacterium]|nr:hypothetical protein [Flavobacteriales bacterium]
MKTQDKKVEIREEAKQKIDEIFDTLDKWKAKKNDVKEESKMEYEKNILELEVKKAGLKSRFREIENASDKKWEEINEAVEESSDHFKQGFSKLKSIVS